MKVPSIRWLAAAFLAVLAWMPVAARWTAGLPWVGLRPVATQDGSLLAGTVEERSTAARLGVLPSDRVLAIGDVEPPAVVRDARGDAFLKAIANRYRAGDRVTWRLERSGAALLLTGPLERLPRALLLSHFLSYLPFLAIALFLAWLRPSDDQVRLLAFTILAMVTGNFLRPVTDMALDSALGVLLQHVCAVGRFLGPALLVHWASGFPEPSLKESARRRVLALAYGIPLLLLVVEEAFLVRGMLDAAAPYLLYTGPIARLGYFQLRFWVFVGSFVAAGALLVHAYRRIGAQARKKLKWVVWSVCIVAATDAAIVTVSFYLQGGYQDVTLGAYRNGLYSLTAIGLAIAVLKEDLFDIDWMIRRSTVYFLSAGAVFVLFSMLEEVVASLLSRFAPGGSSFVATVVAGTVAAAVFVPLRRRLDKALDRLTGPASSRSAPGSSSA